MIPKGYKTLEDYQQTMKTNYKMVCEMLSQYKDKKVTEYIQKYLDMKKQYELIIAKF
jgi:hypothetical protein